MYNVTPNKALYWLMSSRTSAELWAELGRTPGQAVGPYLTSSYGVGCAEGMVEATIRVCFPLRRKIQKKN